MHRGVAERIGLIAAAVLVLAGRPVRAEEFDLILRHGTVLDGSGLDRRVADVAVRRGKIARVGDLSQDRARIELDVTGLFVAPGFINIHSHPNADALPRAQNMLTQGVTTEIANPDGGGPTDLQGAAAAMSERGLATNLGFYIGFNSIWTQVMGRSDRRASALDLARMRAIVVEGLQAGAWGVSAGLDYKPGYYATTDEVVSVVGVARSWRTDFPNHERLTPESGYSSLVGIGETLDIGRRAGLTPVITHVKAQGAEQGRGPDILDAMDEATRAGRYVAADIYPYTAGFNNIRTLLFPGWALEGGEEALFARFRDPLARARIAADVGRILDLRWHGASGVYVVNTRRELASYVAEWNVSPGEAVIRLNEQYRGALPDVFLRFGAEEDVTRMLRHPNVAVACDCGSILPLSGHPRYFGTFPRVLGHYVRETQVLTWEDAIRKMTALPAATIGMVDRGLLAPGMAADVTVFDPRTIADKATYESAQLSEGVRLVLVNGRVALRDGEPTGAQGGQVLWRSPNMPSRPMTGDRPRRLAGAANVSAGGGSRAVFRLAVALRQDRGRPDALGELKVVDRAGDTVFAATAIGALQVAGRWASLTGEGRLASGEPRSFVLVVDPSRGTAHGAAAVSLAIDAGPEFRGASAAGIRAVSGS